MFEKASTNQIIKSVSDKYDLLYNFDNIFSFVMLKKIELMGHISQKGSDGKYKQFPNYYFFDKP